MVISPKTIIIPSVTCQTEIWPKVIIDQPTGLGGSLASNLGEGVLRKAGIEDGIGNLITMGGLIHLCRLELV